jgi:malic enzyme
VRPTTLIGTSGQAGAFTREVIETMASQVDRPLILPLSNPTAQCEAVPADIYAWTGGRALVAAGSPFPAVEYGGRHYRIGQGNNAFIFPAVGLAAIIGGLPSITEQHFHHAARALAATMTPADLDAGLLYPPISKLRDVCSQVAAELLVRCGVATRQSVMEQIRRHTWEPVYKRYVPAGVEI